MFAGHCDQYYVELVTVSAEPNKQDFNITLDMPIAARVDEKPILTGKVVRGFGNFGEKDLHSFINFGDNSSLFISDLVNGTKLRLNLKVDNSTNEYYRFGLNGSSTSLQTATQMCEKFSTDTTAQDDSHFFEKNTKPIQKYNSNSSKTDEQYF